MRAVILCSVICTMICTVIAFSLPAPAGDAKTDAIKKELAALQGDWLVVSSVYEGKNLLEDEKVTINIKGDWVTIFGNGKKKDTSVVKLDPSKSPKAYDEHPLDPEDNKVVLGIYKLEKDMLTLCYTMGKERPKAFDGKADDTGLIVMKRQKP